MLQFAWPWLFATLPLPWLLRALLPAAATNREGSLYVPFAVNLPASDASTAQPGWQWSRWLLLLIWLLLVTAAARPQWLGDIVQMQESGRSLILAMDVSGSMETNDLDPHNTKLSRLDVVKQIAGNFIRERRGDRIGLILFGSNAYLQAPLTFDRRTVHTLLEEAVIGIAGRETAIGNALGLGIKRLRQAPEGKAVLILLTDGANTAGVLSPRRAAELAAQAGLRIYTIGVGATEMPSPTLLGSPPINPSADLDEEMLQYIAEQTGGRYFRATDRHELSKIYTLLNQLEPVAGGSEIVRPVIERYPWPLGAALLLSFLLAAPLPALRESL